MNHVELAEKWDSVETSQPVEPGQLGAGHVINDGQESKIKMTHACRPCYAIDRIISGGNSGNYDTLLSFDTVHYRTVL